MHKIVFYISHILRMYLHTYTHIYIVYILCVVYVLISPEHPAQRVERRRAESVCVPSPVMEPAGLSISVRSPH